MQGLMGTTGRYRWFAAFCGIMLNLVWAAAAAYAQSPVPFISQPIVPEASAPGGAGLTIAVNGVGFVPGSAVNWSGTALATQFVSGSRLTATVPASDISSAGTASITVTSPQPGGGVSNTVFFPVTVPTATVFLSQFVETVGSTPWTIAPADFNHDGKLDLAISSFDAGDVSVLLGNGDGTFQPVQTYSVGTNATGTAAGDLNGDGKPDLAVANYSGNSVSIFLGNGDGTFGPPKSFAVGVNPGTIVIGDFNGDGKPDLAVSSYYDGSVAILLGNGDGTFQPQITDATGGQWLAAGDFNGDGKLDLALAGGSSFVGVALGNGDGTFQPAVYYSVGGATTSVAVGDLNGDGVLDLAVADSLAYPTPGSVSILLGKGDGTFGPPGPAYAVGINPYSITMGDFNGDGKLDLAVVNNQSFTLTLSILLGNGDGTFQPQITQAAGANPFSLAVGDFNNDGREDLVAVGTVGTALIMLQTSAVLSPSTVTFAGQGVGTSSSPQTVTLSNNGTTAINLTGISVTGTNSGDFSQTNSCPGSLAPGANCAINVTFTPTVFGNRSASLSVTDNAAGSPQSIPLSGFGNAPVATLQPTSLTFAQQVVGATSPPQHVSLINSGTLSLAISSIALSGASAGDFLEANSCPASLAPNKNCVITVQFRPLMHGTLAAAVSITDNAAGSPQMVTLTGVGTFFKVSPASVNFGNVPVGQSSAPQTVSVTNTARNAQAISIRVQGGVPGDFAETNTCGASLGPGASCTASVTFAPSTRGTHHATLQVGGGGGSVNSVALTGTGT